MKVKLKDLRSNPFRNLKKYPVRKDRVEGMKQSILDTGYWKNILVRKQNGKVEMAYGHHRKAALVELYGEGRSIDVILDVMTDAIMLKRMANENDIAAELETDVADAAVEAARKYLKEHPEEHKKYHVVHVQTNLRATVAPRIETFENAIPNRETVSNFLGGFWSESRVREVVERLQRYGKKPDDPDYLEKEAVQKFGLSTHAATFQRAVKSVKSVPPEKQKKAAERIVEDEDFKRSNMEQVLLEEKGAIKKPKKKEKELIDFREFLKNYDKKICALFLDADRIEEIISKNSLTGYENEFNRLRDSCGILLYRLRKIFKGEEFDNLQIAATGKRKDD